MQQFQSGKASQVSNLVSCYDCCGFYDEMFAPGGVPRPGVEFLADRLGSLPLGDLQKRQKAADHELLNMGITFNVYGIDDMYHDQRIIREGIMPEFMIASSKGYLKQLHGMNPSKGIWCHITGTDLVRGADGQIYVLEDNLRCPSGVSYVIENREVMKRTFPQLFEGRNILPVETYPEQLLKMLQYVAPASARDPNVVVLTPGVYNSAYFEHCFLAQQMGVELVQGSDLVVSDGFVWMRTTRGLKKVDVIYRRIDDDFLDPNVLRPDSTLGVRGLMDAYRQGKVALVNAPGTGVADDKAVYAYVPKMIEFYLGESIILPNVPTYMCADPKECQYVLDHIHELVVKPANESGGYGIVLGPRATKEQLAICKEQIQSNPRNYVAQPMLALSTVPTLCGDTLEGRHVDLRPYILLLFKPKYEKSQLPLFLSTTVPQELRIPKSHRK